MIFPSYQFIFGFLPLILLIWLSALPFMVRLWLLTLGGLIFYGWWNYHFVPLLVGSIVVDYFCGMAISRARGHARKRLFLAVSIVANLSVLGFFKYYDFFISSLNALGASLPLLHLTLPLGISFYIFKSISYSYDIYRGDAEPALDMGHFAAFITLFPELVAGPIVRYGALAEQLRHLRSHRGSRTEFDNGVWLFVIGLAKKLLIADRLAPLADNLFDGHGPMQAASAWLGSMAYSLQLYFDFSGYSDMAIGLGLMLGFRFPVNFISPYKATSIADFWNRWHITLSHYLRDYLFIPLGGSRGTLTLTMRNLMLTMFLGGLWHGAAWTFVVWGLYHGVLLVLNAAWNRVTRLRLPHIASVAITLLSVHLGWVLFRAPSFERAMEIYAGMVTPSNLRSLFAPTIVSDTFGRLPAIVDIAGGVEVAPFLLLALLIALFAPNSQQIPRPFGVRSGIAIGFLFLLCVASLGKETPFIYFQF